MKHKVIDFYSGCGGICLGAIKAGYDLHLALEKDAWACKTLKKNFNYSKIVLDSLNNFDTSQIKEKISVVSGGPPCQGFSIAASNRRDPSDSRNQEYKMFLTKSFEIKPKVIFFENVPEIIKFKNIENKLIIDEISDLLKRNGYSCSHKIINSADYGIPQNRKRFFLIALLGKEQFNFPASTHSSKEDFFLKKHLTIEDAISDLPKVYPKQFEEDSVLTFSSSPKNSYQKKLISNKGLLKNHISMRHTDKTIEKFRLISEQKMSSSFDQNHRIINKDKPSPTITASFYSSFIHYNQFRNLTVREAARVQSFPDDFEFFGKKTTLSKSLLRKKGIFEELHLDQFNQVGNAVPPMLAEILFKKIREYL